MAADFNPTSWMRPSLIPGIFALNQSHYLDGYIAAGVLGDEFGGLHPADRIRRITSRCITQL